MTDTAVNFPLENPAYATSFCSFMYVKNRGTD